jgi:5-methylcytosine-specific restriction enzyme A
MPWKNGDPEKRRRDQQVYGDREYQRNRKIVLRRANGRCEQCGTRSRRLQVDHIVPLSAGGTHDASNLQVLCSGPGSCHARKSAAEGGRSRSRKPSADPEPRPRTAW